MSEDLLAFEVWAPFAFFRKSETTTTSLTFSFMPRSAAVGLIGAILGLKFEESPTKLAASKIAIEIESPVTKIPFSATFTDTKEIWPRLSAFLRPPRKKAWKSKRVVEFRTVVKMELLRDPHYRIYFDDCEETKQVLEKMLLNHETVFTPYLGSSSMLANFKYIGRYNYETVKLANPTPVASIVPFFTVMPRIHLEKDVTFAVEQNVPIHLTSDRVLSGTYDAVYSPTAAELKVLGVEAQRVRMQEDELHVVFIPTEIPPQQTA
jgi:CRISPR-associated protein Cas5h